MENSAATKSHDEEEEEYLQEVAHSPLPPLASPSSWEVMPFSDNNKAWYQFGHSDVDRSGWMADEECMACNSCQVEFGFFTRRHHCRFVRFFNALYLSVNSRVRAYSAGKSFVTRALITKAYYLRTLTFVSRKGLVGTALLNSNRFKPSCWQRLRIKPGNLTVITWLQLRSRPTPR